MNEIVLFSNNCPRCRVLKAKLDKRQISYTENNDVDAMIEMGIKEAPMLMIDGELKNFTDANAWINNQ